MFTREFTLAATALPLMPRSGTARLHRAWFYAPAMVGRIGAVGGLVLLASLVALSAAQAVALLAGTDNYVYDGFCFEGEGASYGLAAVVVPGLCLAVVAIVRGVRRPRGANISARVTLGLAFAATLWLVAWSGMVILSNMAFADEDQSAPLPAILCTYEDPPFDGTL